MSIISFPITAAHPLCAAVFEALAPTLSRIRHALGNIAPSSAAVKRFQRPAVQPTSKAAVHSRPLRVVCETDPAISPDCAGRMVISGRMADVCAELDRMALRATTTKH